MNTLKRLSAIAFLLAIGTAAPASAETDAAGYRADALAIETLVDANYAYLDRFPDQAMPMTDRLRAEAEAVHDDRSLLVYAERALLLLADHHAITGSSFADSWAIVPSYSDLWIERRDGDYVITAVRSAMPAADAGVGVGDRLAAIGGVATEDAVTAFWHDLGVDGAIDDAHAGFAARILAAGRRDRPRNLEMIDAEGGTRTLTLPNLYTIRTPPAEPLTVHHEDGRVRIVFHDSLGEQETISAFDAAMAALDSDEPIVLDLRDTPSGGNTSVARAIMGWFVTRPRFYQVHNLPSEERETGIPRQWVEQVLPRAGRHHSGSVRLLVGRWTGSMGEGLAVGFDALGYSVQGGPMAGLLGAVYDYTLPNSGQIIKFPSERLYAVDGTPREAFVPTPIDESEE